MAEAITVCIDDDLNRQLENFADRTSLSKTGIVVEAIKDYLSSQSWHTKAILEGLRQAEIGQTVPHEEVRRKWEKKLENLVD